MISPAEWPTSMTLNSIGKPSIISLDTECTGPDFWHGCMPFCVSTCTPSGQDRCWHWKVNPKTRKVVIPPKEVNELQKYIDRADSVVFHNAKFDIRALSTIGIKPSTFWNKEIHDTHIASHILWSGESHALKDLCVLHLDFPATDEQHLQKAAKEAQGIAKKLGWDVARLKHPCFPGLPKTSHWECMDYWLPCQVAAHKGFPESHPWHTIMQEYAINDAQRTILLWELLSKLIEHEDLWDHYIKRRDLLKPVYGMENAGLYMRASAYEEEHTRYTELNTESLATCRELSGYEDMNLNSHQQVSRFLFQERGLESVKKTKSGESVDGDVVDHLLETLPKKSLDRKFVLHLQRYRKTDKCLSFLDTYLAYSLDHIIHPGLNICGTGTTRFSSQNPNGENVSRQEKYNLRRVFGPAPGRAWLSVDYANIELRMLAYAAGETELIKAFERGESVHMNFSWVVCPWAILKCSKGHTDSWFQEQKLMLSPDQRKKLEKAFKETDQYHWVKNGDFALTYGASRNTADTSYHIDGAYDKIRSYFTNLDGFMSERVREAYRTHTVYTLGGYKLQIPYGREYTTAVDYYCQGSAGWVMCLGMLNCYDFFKVWNTRNPGYNAHMLMQIHDELIFDIPADHPENLNVINKICRCMERPGTELGVPTPTEAKLIIKSWAEGDVLDLSA